MSSVIKYIRYQWQLFLTAVQFFTRIPVNVDQFDASKLNLSTRYFPLIGILIGSLSALVFVVSDFFFPLSLAVLVSMAAGILLTGAFHEDGLADMADGFGGGWGKQQVLTIMVDSRLGSYGAIALVLVLTIKYQALVTLSKSYIPVSLVAGHAISRLNAVWVMRRLSYVKESGKAKPLATKLTQSNLIIATVFGLVPLFFMPVYLWPAVIPMILVWHFLIRLMQRKIGGYTGDCLGAMQQLSEIAFYLGLIACHELHLYFRL